MILTEHVWRWLPLLAAVLWAGVIFSLSSIDQSNLPDAAVWESLRNPPTDATVQPDGTLSPTTTEANVVLESQIATWEWMTRKGAHLVTFGVLGFLVAAAAAAQRLPRPWLIGWVVATLYGVIDEIHQAFVPGRTGQATDVLIDAFGALLGVTAWWLLARRRAALRR